MSFQHGSAAALAVRYSRLSGSNYSNIYVSTVHTLCHDKDMKQYRWNKDKNHSLIQKRNISFEAIVYAIDKGCTIDVFDHPNPKKYPNQKIYALNIDNYVYLVPYVIEDDGTLFLKTIIPSRKATKQYLGSRKNEK